MAGVSYNLGVNSSSAVAGVQALGNAFSGMQGVVGKLGSALGLLGVSFAAFKSAGGFVDSMKGVFESGKELATLRAETGQSITSLVTLRKAMKEAGMEGGLAESITMLQKSLGGVNDEGQPTVGMFARLGLSIKQLQGKDVVTQFEAIGAAIRRLGSQEEKVAAARAIWGRSGAQMLAMIGDPSAIESAKASMGSYGALMERDAAMFAKITNALESLSAKVKGFFVGFADQVGPVLLPLLEKLKSFSLVNVGAQAGAIVKTLAAAFGSGQLGELVGLSLEVGATKFGNLLLQGITGFVSAYGAYWAGVVQDWQALFSDMPSVWVAMKEGFIGAIQAMGAVLLEVFQKPIVALQAGIEYALQTLIEKMPKGLQKVLGFGAGIQHESYDQIKKRKTEEGGSLFGKTAEDMAVASEASFGRAKGAAANVTKGIDIKSQISDIVASFKEGFANGKLLDESGLMEALKKLSASIIANAPKAPAAPITGINSVTGGVGGGGRPDIHAMAQAGMDAIPKPEVFTDRLAKIGAFIGGPAGTKTGQDHIQKEQLKYGVKVAALMERLVGIAQGKEHGTFKGSVF